MMVAAGAVDMPVSDLFRSRGADFTDRDVEVERHPGQGMVSVESHLVPLDLGDDDDLLSLVVGGFQLHSLLEIFASLDLIGGYHGDLRCIGHPISFLGRDCDGEGIPRFLSFHGFFEALHDLSLAMQVGERAAILGGVDNFLLVVGEGVVEEDDGVFGDVHWNYRVGLGILAPRVVAARSQ